ncbi:unnamed protein product [Arctogadus glacialis]
MRKADGVNTKCMREEFEKSSTFKGVSVSQPGDGGRRKAEVFRERFFVSLADNIERRLDDNGIISAAAALNPSNWPSDEDERILYGDEKLLAIHKTLAVEAATSPILLKEFHEFKCHGVTGESMRKILTAVATLPVSTAECERDVASFPARRFAEMWLKQGHHAAIDPPTGKQKKEAEVRHQSGLFS